VLYLKGNGRFDAVHGQLTGAGEVPVFKETLLLVSSPLSSSAGVIGSGKVGAMYR